MQRPPSEPRTIVLLLGGPLLPGDIPSLCDHARELFEGSVGDFVVCDVGAVVDPDATTVDALARLQLTAKRCGRRLRLRRASSELRDLLGLMGFGDVVPCGPDLLLEPRGQAEERKQALGIEEE